MKARSDMQVERCGVPTGFKVIFSFWRSYIIYTVFSTVLAGAFCNPICAQSSAPSYSLNSDLDAVILNKKDQSYDLGPFLKIQKDPDKNLTIETISTDEFSQNFSQVSEKQIKMLNPFTVYWIKLKIHNKSGRTINWWLIQKYVWQNRIDFYEPLGKNIDGSVRWKCHQSGSLLPFSERIVKNRYFIFPLNIKADHEATYYLRLRSLTGKLKLQLHSPENFLSVNQQETVLNWLFFGIILVIFIYNSFVGYSFRDWSFLFYVLYLATFGMYTFIDKGYAIEYLWPEFPIWNSRSDIFISGWSTIFLALFSISFLRLKTLAPGLRVALIAWICISFPINMLFSIYYTGLLLDLTRYAYLLGIPLFLVSALIASVKGYRPARYYLCGYSIFFLAILINIFYMLAILPDSSLWDWSYQTGVSLEIVLFAIGLSSKINLLQKEKEAAQAQSLADQRNRIEKMRQIDRLKDEFLASTSHELRTPLHGIIGISEALRAGIAGKISDEANRQLQLVESSGRRLANLVNDILDSARLKHRDLALQKKPLLLEPIISVALELNSLAASSAGLELRSSIPAAIGSVDADENRIQQILQNLIANAIKFTDAGSVTISARQPGIEWVEVAVTDTGPGIPEDEHEQIFEAFVQRNSVQDQERGGVGLGLSITRALVELHGGRIRVESPVHNNSGTRFLFTLPAALHSIHSADEMSERSEAHPKTGPESGGDRPGGLDLQINAKLEDSFATLPDQHHVPYALSDPAQARILIVDDEPVNLQVLSNFVQLQGWQAVTANSGPEALEVLQRDSEIQVVVLDLMMPRMSGFETARQIRKQYSQLELPILILTARNQTEDLLAGLQAGANDFLVKPATQDATILRISNLLNLCNAHRERLATRQTVQDAVRRERTIINQNLHDHIGAHLIDLQFLSKEIGLLLTQNPELASRLTEQINQASLMMRDQMFMNEDLDLLADNFIEGINLILLRRYSGAEREIEFHSTPDAESAAEKLGEELTTGIYAVTKEIATNDLKYGNGMTKWSFTLWEDVSKNAQLNPHIVITVESSTNYRLAKHGVGMGTQNITRRIAQLNGTLDMQIIEGRFFLQMNMPLT